MSNDADAPMTEAADQKTRTISTDGAMARARRRRLAVVAVLAVMLVVLAYVTYYYSQNRSLPVPRVATKSDTVQTPEYQYSFSGTGAAAMTKPTGIALLGDRVYVTDLGTRNVRVFDRSGTHLFDFGAISADAAKRLSSPVHVAIGPDSTVWVTDRNLRKVVVFDQDGTFLRTFVPDGDPHFSWSPLAIAFSADGDLYVTDVGNSSRHRVLRFDADGRLKAQWGSVATDTASADAPGVFHFPNGLAISGTGTSTVVYVADGDNHRVQVFTRTGMLVRVINTSGTPRGLAVDAAGRLWVVDALAHRLDLYSLDGVQLTDFGGNGTSPGLFTFPNDVVIDAAGRLFVTDRDNNQVQVWGYPVAEIPGITRITPASTLNVLTWLATPLVLLLALIGILALRPRTFVVTADFVEGMLEGEQITAMQARGYRWVIPEEGSQRWRGRIGGGSDLGELLHAELHSTTDSALIRDRFAVDEPTAALLAMARRYRVLCTENLQIARLAVALGIDVYDRATWIDRYAHEPADPGGERPRRARRGPGEDGTSPR